MIMVATMHDDTVLLMRSGCLQKRICVLDAMRRRLHIWTLCAPTQRIKLLSLRWKSGARWMLLKRRFLFTDIPASFVRRMTRMQPRPARTPGKEWPYGHRNATVYHLCCIGWSERNVSLNTWERSLLLFLRNDLGICWSKRSLRILETRDLIVRRTLAILWFWDCIPIRRVFEVMSTISRSGRLVLLPQMTYF